VVINTSAYNQVDKAADDPEAAHVVNTSGPLILASHCEAQSLTLLHVSTDYVFGTKESRDEPYRETDAPGPISLYGVTKKIGESFVRSQCKRHFVVRTCGLYGHAGRNPGRGNFVETMLRLGAERNELAVVNDQHCTPTSTHDLAAAIAALIETDAYGLYHATNTGETTWFEFAEEIFRQTGRDVALRPISSEEVGAKAERPRYSVLNCDKLAAAIGRSMPHWRDALAHYLETRNV
jgi:dTDP-4-dehydrorhamnose reductase